MTDEDAFLQSLLNNPADDVARLVYADWLDERGETAKAEFLRLTAESEMPSGEAVGRQLQELAAVLDTGWLAVVSNLPVERCGQPRQTERHQFQAAFARPGDVVEPKPVFEFECPRQWEGLAATADAAVRFCAACRENVYYCDTIMTARRHAEQGHCVAVDLGIIRRDGDLDRPVVRMGRFISEPADDEAAREEAREHAREHARWQAYHSFDAVSERRAFAKRRNDPEPGELP